MYDTWLMNAELLCDGCHFLAIWVLAISSDGSGLLILSILKEWMAILAYLKNKATPKCTALFHNN
jgi:hypothetical protein